MKLGVEIPPGLLEPGYNAAVLPGGAALLEEPVREPLRARTCGPTSRLRDSYVEMDYEWKDVPRELSALSSFVFDPRLMPAGAVHLVTEDDSARERHAGRHRRLGHRAALRLPAR